jgi:hypothetical protein
MWIVLVVVGCLACHGKVGLTMTREAAVSISGTERKFCSSAAEANLKRSRDFFFLKTIEAYIPHHQP